MRKKLICILAGLTVAVGLVGCGQKKAVEETTVATSETGSESSTVLNGTASKSSTGSDGADTTLTITVGGSQVMLDEVRYYAYTAQATYETYYLTTGKLTKKEKSSVKTKALEYFKNTNVKLAKKINISEGRLIKVFEKAEIADKTEKKMEKDGSSTKEMYIKWKKGNNVTAESQWNNINFKEAIFTLEDVK